MFEIRVICNPAEPGVWPTPEEAYANAPSINSEIVAAARNQLNAPF